MPRRSIVTNAKPHLKKKYILSFDIKNFFPTTTEDKVVKIFTKFFPNQIENLPYVIYKNHLPQGAPTSPYLANFALWDFDNYITKYCNLNEIAYTRYADDLTFSFEYTDINHLIILINKKLREDNYYLSKRKTKLMPNWRRQSVTGITVNEKLSIPRERKNLIRAYNHLKRNGKWNADDNQLLAGLNGYKNMINLTLK